MRPRGSFANVRRAISALAIAPATEQSGDRMTQREAMNMAVLSQPYIALAGFEEARARYAAAARIAEIERGIVDILRSTEQVGAVDRLRTIRAEIDPLRA